VNWDRFVFDSRRNLARPAERRVPRHRPVLEELGRRTLPSASPLVGAVARLLGPPAQVSRLRTLSIRGTGEQLVGPYLGITGDLYRAGRRVGTYQEFTQLSIVGGQPVGGTGVATFRFFAHPSPPKPSAKGLTRPEVVVGTITTVDTSRIVGASPTGDLVVQSVGAFVRADGVLRGARGSFASASALSLAPFHLETAVHFAVAGRPSR
jgi:hypothetical protein